MMKGRGGGGIGRFATRKREAGAGSLESPTVPPVIQDATDMEIDTDPVDQLSFPSFQRPKTAEDQQQFSNIGMLETNSLASYDADVALQFGLDNFQAMEDVYDDTEAPEVNESSEMMETLHNTSETTPSDEETIDAHVDGTAPSSMEVDQSNVPNSQGVEDSEMEGNNNVPDSQGDDGRIAFENTNDEAHTDSNATDVTKSSVTLSSDSLPSEGGDMESDRLTEISTAVEVHGSPPVPLSKSVKTCLLSRLRGGNPSKAQGAPEVKATLRETNKHVDNPETHMGQDKTHEVKTPRSIGVEHPTSAASQITPTVDSLVIEGNSVADGINDGPSGPSGPKPSNEKEVQVEKVQCSVDHVEPPNEFEQVLPIVRATQATRTSYQKQGFLSPQKSNMSTPQGGSKGSNLPLKFPSRMTVTPEFPSTLQARVGRSIHPTNNNASNNSIIQNQPVSINDNRSSGIASMPKTPHQNQACVPSKHQTANTISTFSEAEFSSDTFDDLLSNFLTDLRDGMDIFDKGDIELLKYQVELSQAHSMALRYRGEMMHLLDELSSVQSMADRSLDQFVGS